MRVRICVPNWSLTENAILQISQAYGTSQECVRICVFKLQSCEKMVSNTYSVKFPSHTPHKNMTTVQCVCTYVSSIGYSEKILFDNPHKNNGFSLMCGGICSFKRLFHFTTMFMGVYVNVVPDSSQS